MDSKKIVFISHANPEDNDFVLWLGSQLANAGYQVWSDLTHLIGGEIFWDVIEDCIRNHSAKFLICVSRSSTLKDGVLDEVNVAIGHERTNRLTDFVIPLRIDDLPFNEFRANLGRKNAIDFQQNWADGFNRLIQKLEKDGVPRQQSGYSLELANWYKDHFHKKNLVIPKEEACFSNWLPIVRLPENVYFHNLEVQNTDIEKIANTLGVPYFKHYRLIGTFAPALELQALTKIKLEERYAFSTEKFLGGENSLNIAAKEANKQLLGMIKKTWNAFAQSKGLSSYDLADGATVWYPKLNLIPDNKVVLQNASGRQVYRQLVGQSVVKNAYWHFGIYFKPVLSAVPHFTLRPHVIFTTDGAKPIDSKTKMHSLRRSFCKNWWNDEWRDRTICFLNWLSNGQSELEIPFSEFASFKVGTKLLPLISPVQFRTNLTAQELNEYTNEAEEDLETTESPAEQILEVAES